MMKETEAQYAISRLSALHSDLASVLNHCYELELENERLRGIEEKYNALLNDSIKHGETMMGHLLKASIDGKIG